MLFSTALHLVFPSQGRTLNLELDDWLTGCLTILREPLTSASSALGFQLCATVPSIYTWLGPQDQVLMLMWQAFYPLNSLLGVLTSY